jgi:hypothetical protein
MSTDGDGCVCERFIEGSKAKWSMEQQGEMVHGEAALGSVPLHREPTTISAFGVFADLRRHAWCTNGVAS